MAKEKRRSIMGSRVKSVSSGKKKSQLTSEKVNQSSGYSGKWYPNFKYLFLNFYHFSLFWVLED